MDASPLTGAHVGRGYHPRLPPSEAPYPGALASVL